MENLKAFIKSNIYGVHNEEEGGLPDVKVFKSGLVGLDVLSKIKPETEIENCRLNYIWNLCLVDPVPFPIPDAISGLERACMMLSFGDYENVNLSMYDFGHELVGGIPTNDGVYKNSILIVKCNNTRNKKEYCYSTQRYRFDDIMVESLTVEEQSILLVEMIKVFNTEVCQDLKKLKVQAYMDRLLFPKNEKSEIVKRSILHHHIMLNLEPSRLDSADGDITDSIFEIPFVFQSEVEKQLGEAYYACSAYESALTYFKKYGNSIKTIYCLIKLNRNEEAIAEAKEEINKIGEVVDHRSRTRLCNINILLGTITGEESYFDTAFSAYRSYEPLKAKGAYFLKANRLNKAVDSFKEALELAPLNVELLFLYASALTSSKRFEEAAAVYERLVADDQKNVIFLRNLAMCRLQIEDVENGLKSLKEASRYDQQVMQAYFLMSIKYNIPKEIIYSLERVSNFEDFEEGVMYLVESKTLEKKEVKSALMKNSRISEQIESLLVRIDKLEL